MELERAEYQFNSDKMPTSVLRKAYLDEQWQTTDSIDFRYNGSGLLSFVASFEYSEEYSSKQMKSIEYGEENKDFEVLTFDLTDQSDTIFIAKETNYWPDEDWVRLTVTNTVFDDMNRTWRRRSEVFEYFNRPVISDIDQRLGNSVLISPNPVTSDLTIDLSSGSSKKPVNLTIYSNNGAVKGSYEINRVRTIDLTYLKPGLYYYTINNGSDVESGKLIKK